MANQSPGEPRAAGRKCGRRKDRRGRGEANAQEGTEAAGPPRSPRQFSSNWKALQELLRQKANGSNDSLPACQTHTKKTHPLKAGKSQEVLVTNGNRNVVNVKPTNKMDNGSGKYNLPLAKAKPEGVAVVKNMNGTRSNRKDCKDKTKYGYVLKEKDDIKHKRRKAEEHVEQQLKEAEIWFDDVDPKDIEAAIGYEAAKIARRNLGLETDQCSLSVKQVLVKEDAFEGLTRAVAMDCEMVGVGPKGDDSIVARVSIVNQFGKCVYDKYVKPTEEVTDYRTAVSGIRPENINTGEDFKTVQKEVADILNGRILVGHALRNDLKVLFLDHPQKKIRDTQRYKPFRQRVGIKNGRPSLKLLCEKLLNIKVQTSEHCSVQDAQAAMRLYTLEKKKWEAAVKNKSNNKNCKP
ncbi:RNA exonuclease 4 [Melopsittacus undulatus]|uniref:RNA exonuclease 4 n=1 Tax=Melopsittacus undulatus TaxID=13146 RepID=UPI001469DC1C|nr:RNA exonuclease 4 [Melopsittacus undulatus]